MTSKRLSKESVQKALERNILHGLSCEWEAALYFLKPDQRINFKKPLFSLKKMKSRLGYWSAEKHEICINRYFVLNHQWDSIREVLYHEMAHQFADQVLHTQNETPHGSAFQEACHLLRANPKASGHYQSLHERVQSGTLESDDRIMLRIRKLMALSESSNQHEAQAAMSKVHELILKYNIRLLELNENRNFENIFIGTPMLRHPREEYFIANLLQDFYFVQGIWISAYVIEKNKMGRVLEINGTAQNIRIASYVYDFIKQYIHSKWIEYNKELSLNRYRKSDFSVGIVEGFRTKLESQQRTKKTVDGSPYPVRIEDPLLTKYFSHRYPYVHRFRKNTSGDHENIFNDGKKIGKKMVIYKGIHEKIKNRIRLLQ
ncbi:MAG: DUF2786 domain-containing protein [Deltaproteobacteria bacterium]|nr:DUF2786 domain-containing protein [Deltaproteobacteria bacterium]MBW1846834.1 DUF2786 domain-containing protein [Deltaproteobacteria bacterium]MBW2181320.1 DUF2786 domain-containing protein [Deltaproteobacteria bacterium]MBW2365653.1 DUF2786 domain-containing protein [Deltaproteobacteria bacterium]